MILDTMNIKIAPSDRILMILLLVPLLFFALASLVLAPETFQRVFEEDGVVESISFYGWIAAAGLILIRVRPFGFRAGSFALLSLAFAAREADWQKKFTTDGVLKINFYQNSSIPLAERLIAGIIVLILIIGLAYAVYASFRFLFFERGWESRCGVWLFLTGVCLAVGKSLDRIPGELNHLFGITMSVEVVHHFQAFEEGLEALGPIFFLWSIWLSPLGASYLARRTGEIGKSQEA